MKTSTTTAGPRPPTPRLKHHLLRVFSGGTPETGNDAFWSNDDGGVAWVAIGDMSGRERVESTERRITEQGRESRGLSLLPKGTLIYSMYASLGHVAELKIPATINQALLGFEFKPGVNKQYVKWQLRYLQPRVVEDASNSTQDNLNAEKVRNLPIPLPPPPRQRAIADYLDRETARLDALVAAKERVLGLLAEKRRALITRAVTRGLDSRVPLRDSGIPWLGETPRNWRIERLKFHLHWIEQGWSPICDNMPATLEEWGVLKAGCVNGWDFDPDENKRLPDDTEPLPEYEVRQGDVLMSRANTTALLGSTSLVRDVRARLLLCDKLYRLGVNDATLYRQYLVAFLRSLGGRYEFERDATGASNSMQNIGQDSVRNLWLPVPPIEEQCAIVDYITAATIRLEAMRTATEHTVRLLKERRAALIAAAVTGRVDVPRVPDSIDCAAEETSC